jgi:hypothetical protein
LEQRRLAGEVVVQRAPRDVRAAGDVLELRRCETSLREDRQRRVEQRASRVGGVIRGTSGHR